MTQVLTAECDPDRVLVLACQDALREGRTAPFHELYERHHLRVYRQCLYILHNEYDARDACHDAFHRVMLRISSFEHHSRFSTWLRNVARNCCRDLMRRSRQAQLHGWKLSGTGLDEAAEPMAAAAEAPAATLFRCEIRDHLERSIARLSPALRSVVALRYYAQCSYEDIVLRLGISMGTVKSRLFRAHAALEQELALRIDLDELSGVA